MLFSEGQTVIGGANSFLVKDLGIDAPTRRNSYMPAMMMFGVSTHILEEENHIRTATGMRCGESQECSAAPLKHLRTKTRLTQAHMGYRLHRPGAGGVLGY